MTTTYKPTGCKSAKALTHEQFLHILDDLRVEGDYKLLSICLIMGLKGLRISDTVALKIEDIFYAVGTLRPQLKFRNKKQKKNMVVPLDNGKNPYFKEQLETYFHLVSGRGSHTDLFPSSRYGAVTPSWVKAKLMKFSGQYGIEQISPHSFRKYCGKRMHEMGASIEIISAFYGHADVSITQTYLDINQVEVTDAINAIDF